AAKSERDQYTCTHHEGREWPAHGRIRVHQLRRWEHVPAAAPRHPRDAAPILRLPPKGVYDRPYASRLAARLNLFLRCLTALTAGWGGGRCRSPGDQLRAATLRASRRNDDVLVSIVHVCHRQTRLRTGGQFGLPNVFT